MKFKHNSTSFSLLCIAFSGPKNKRRSKNDRRYRDRRAEYYEETSSPHTEHPSGSREARYNDMAPKWVDQNGEYSINVFLFIFFVLCRFSDIGMVVHHGIRTHLLRHQHQNMSDHRHITIQAHHQTIKFTQSWINDVSKTQQFFFLCKKKHKKFNRWFLLSFFLYCSQMKIQWRVIYGFCYHLNVVSSDEKSN